MECLQNPCPGSSPGGAGAHSFLAAIGTLIYAQCPMTEDWPPDADVVDGQSFDFIIVGAGSAGCVVANRLTEIPSWRVLVIEAGPDPPFESIVIGLWSSMLKTKYDWGYYAENENKFRNTDPPNVEYWPRGKMLGGTGSINGCIYMRGNPKDYNDWAAAGNLGWDWPTVLKYFKKSENFHDDAVMSDRKSSIFHSEGGMLDVQHYKDTNVDLSNALIGALAEIGIPPLLDLNGPTQFGAARVHATTVDGKRASPATAFLNPAAKRSNLFILKDTLVTKIIIDTSTKIAKGVEVSRKSGESSRFYAKKEVIVSAGTVNSPQLLMLSGIGPKDHLDSLNITVIADLPVGEHLRDHFNLPVIITADQGQPVTQLDNIIEIVKYLVARSGSLTTSFQPDVNGFFSVTVGQDFPDIQIVPAFFPANLKNLKFLCEQYLPTTMCEMVTILNRDQQLFLFYSVLVNVKSEGRIMLRSDDPKDPPLIEPNSLGDRGDLDRIVKGAIRISELVNTTMFKYMNANLAYMNISQCADLEFRSTDYWECIAYNLGSADQHFTGTVKMGPFKDPTSVVNNRLKVHYIKNLRVIDCSIMPTQPKGNTNAPAMMIGERASDFIKEDYNVI